MNQSINGPRIINAVADRRWYDAATDTVHLSDGVTPSRTLTGFDGPRALMLEEQRIGWNWDSVDPSRLSRPGWLGWYISRLRDQVLRELEAEGRPLTIIADLEAVRLNDQDRAVRAERIIYTREILAAIRDVSGPACKVIAYDIPYQGQADEDEEYLDLLMPAIHPHIDAIGCLLYLRNPKQEGVEAFMVQHIQRCRRWAVGKPVEGIVWDGYVDTDCGPVSDEHWDSVWRAGRAGGISKYYLWDSNKGAADLDRIQKRITPIKAAMRKAWAQPAGNVAAA